MFIDATFEGDLAAYAGCRYRIGREFSPGIWGTWQVKLFI